MIDKGLGKRRIIDMVRRKRTAETVIIMFAISNRVDGGGGFFRVAKMMGSARVRSD
jgi:hypothetical protein